MAEKTGVRSYVTSIAPNHRLVVRPERRRQDPETGEWVPIPGMSVRFESYRFATADPDKIKAIETNPDFNLKIFRDDPVEPDPEELAARAKSLLDRLPESVRKTLLGETVLACQYCSEEFKGGAAAARKARHEQSCPSKKE